VGECWLRAVNVSANNAGQRSTQMREERLLGSVVECKDKSGILRPVANFQLAIGTPKCGQAISSIRQIHHPPRSS
jgi:hypothetical protein